MADFPSLGPCANVTLSVTLSLILIDFLLVVCFLLTLCIYLLFSCSVVSNFLQPRRLQHTRLPCPSPSPGVCSNSGPLSQWCHPTISSSVVPFSSSLLSFPASRSFLMSWLFVSGGQSIGAAASASVLPMNIHGWFPFRIDWFDLLAVQGTLRSLPQHRSLKASVLRWAFFMV